MPGITLVDPATQSLTTALDGLALRQRVIGNNLANVNTPGFKASEVSFEQQLQRAQNPGAALSLVSTQPAHITGETDAGGKAQVIANRATSQRLDGNNVDIEKEMADLSETVIHFEAASRVVALRLAMLRTAINEGRR